MVTINPYKFGGGAFFMLLGLVLANKFQNDLLISILGILSVAIGIGILSSQK